MSDVIYSINGPVVTVRNTTSFSMREMVYVGTKQLLGEVIRINDQVTTIQVYESTTGLMPGEAVTGTGSLLNATLGISMTVLSGRWKRFMSSRGPSFPKERRYLRWMKRRSGMFTFC